MVIPKGRYGLMLFGAICFVALCVRHCYLGSPHLLFGQGSWDAAAAFVGCLFYYNGLSVIATMEEGGDFDIPPLLKTAFMILVIEVARWLIFSDAPPANTYHTYIGENFVVAAVAFVLGGIHMGLHIKFRTAEVF